MAEISVIVPVYKVEKYLLQCVDSILAQTFSDLELILVDDGSPDACPAICDRYAERDGRISVIHQKNSGLSAARNAGLAQAKGMYICFIDSDDVISPDYCKVLYNAAMTNGCRIAACKIARFMDEDSLPIKSALQFDNDDAVVMSMDKFLKCQMEGTVEMGVCNRLFHHSVFNGIQFMSGKLHEDIFFAGDLLEKVRCNVAYVDVPLYGYRQRENSIVNQQVATAKCSPDRVLAGGYLVKCAKRADFPYMQTCLDYAVRYPWYFIDPIYVHGRFRENRVFLREVQQLLRDERDLYQTLSLFDTLLRRRMMLFARSKVLYGLNAYARLFRVYWYHILKRDPYADGHGI
ncbi:glycosyltransferase family 2 protein [Blautia obeum]|uniref:glycosyltransferase family 2 protein n=1 Tax=Blautia obeum TaxID=40520 RepID=UPI003D078FB1